MNAIPIKCAHVWQVFDWRDGRWRACGTVQTWSEDHSLACRKAKEGTPALRRERFKVEYLRRDDSISDLGMELSHSAAYSPSSCIVPDIYGEYSRLSRT